MSNNCVLTGKPSIDRPWLNFYPEVFRDLTVPVCSVTEFLKNQNTDWNRPAIEYYGRQYNWHEFWGYVDATAKALKAIGVKKGDRIPVFLQAVPEHLFLLLGAEKLGAAMICRDDTTDELCFAIRKSESSLVFAPDYISKEEEDQFLAETPMKRMVLVSPYTYADRAGIPDYEQGPLEARYPEHPACNPDNLTWEEFIALGRDVEDFEGDFTPEAPLFCAYTSGSTGISKLVIHSAANIVGIAFQMAVFVPPAPIQLTWWLPLLTPALVAATVSMMVFPLSTGQRLILDPFCDVNDLDLGFMRYQPNMWALIPMFCDILMKSKRIPADYDMSHLLAAGAGAEPYNNRKNREVEQFFHDHNCMITFSAGYGISEAGSNIIIPCPSVPLRDGCVGIPMPQTVIGIFKNGSQEEMGYNEVGEICKFGPGNMMGYQNAEMTAETLQLHPDGKLWLHTGDYGYLSEQGVLYVLGRGLTKRFNGGNLYIMNMESKVVEVPGVKDGFFCLVPDQEHEGYFLPYLYLILDEGKALEDVKDQIDAALEPYERPYEIRLIKERKYFHFKTNRKELVAGILEELNQ
ncbi:MAG: AMP-binding protein [Lachnospiraceae bacterium]|nr:AMP-binding protein [Lachnospiraceae bacterium]